MYLDSIEKSIRNMLIYVAQHKGVTTYSGLVNSCDLHLNLADKYDRELLSDMLCDICLYEHENFRPLLSVLVVNESGEYKNLPSYSFFKFAEKLGKYRDGDHEKFAFYEKNRCYKEWQ